WNDMVNRIKKLLEVKKISPAQFADEIEVQRSSLSHVLSGRNKPSLDFMMKIKKRYPEINLDWLLLGEGGMKIETEENMESEADTDEKTGNRLQPEIDFKSTGKQVMSESDKTLYQKLREEEQAVYGTRKPSGSDRLLRVILIYENGTFSSFSPA
ncbi:MAG: helix-turn-helix transcriptional regulator, partial [Chlorobi bacterium]|nr:helix-turn-helix transcriptional regulator [Chlorobiota bacterium]